MIKPLTSWRFVFAILVFLSHMWFLEFEADPWVVDIHNYFFMEGFIGVSFFFILSGFILSYSYQEKILNGTTSFSSFWKARFARIYPLHLLTLLMAMPLMLHESFINFVNKLILNALLLQSFIPSDGFYLTFNAVSWSLSDEMFFYLCFPFLVFLLVSTRNRWLALLPYFIIVPIGIYLTRDVFHHALFYVNPILRTGDFVIGMMLYKLYANRKDIEYLNNRRFASVAEVFTVLLLGAFIYFHDQVAIGYRYSIYYMLPMSLLVYVFAYSKGVISDILSNKTLVFLGDTSFSFYLLHILVLRYYIILQEKYAFIPHGYAAAAIILAVTIAGSIIAYKYYEIPMNSYVKKRLSDSRKTPKARVTAYERYKGIPAGRAGEANMPV